jgi:hypothetical protein
LKDGRSDQLKDRMRSLFAGSHHGRPVHGPDQSNCFTDELS